MDDRNHDEIVSEQNEKLRIQRNYYRRLHVDDLCILNAEEYYESLKDWSKFIFRITIMDTSDCKRSLIKSPIRH